MNFIEAQTMDDIQRKVVQLLLEKGRRVKPRGQWIREITGFSFRLLNPRNRLIYSHARKINLMFAIGEMCWYLRGANELEIIKYYNRRYPQFSDDNVSLHGAYGVRLFTDKLTNFVQWNRVYEMLKEDPDTRQAVMHIHMPHDMITESRDIPCTCYIQFFIRDEKLECIVNMRSNDIIWGTSYDVFSFTMMQEIMAKQLGIEVGPYTHFAGSMHVYEHHLEMAKQIAEEPPYEMFEMPVMPLKPWDGIKELLRTESELRTTGMTENIPSDLYWRELTTCLEAHVSWRSDKTEDLELLASKLPKYYSSLLPVGMKN
ncbi:thymidylate synthase [Bacillus thuringiensis]|uniref:thymidylate synthase n=1 Tax=Bacillus thuringiensis TaxID=1428 RepID=UPI000BF4BA89|nr:thymidylate synthase [Bacillus thuringiensis]PEY73228.1 hypothetical protein CN355_11340 [Bacillus thuringiensis]